MPAESEQRIVLSVKFSTLQLNGLSEYALPDKPTFTEGFAPKYRPWIITMSPPLTEDAFSLEAL
jgi:hypothetical protein